MDKKNIQLTLHHGYSQVKVCCNLLEELDAIHNNKEYRAPLYYPSRLFEQSIDIDVIGQKTISLPFVKYSKKHYKWYHSKRTQNKVFFTRVTNNNIITKLSKFIKDSASEEDIKLFNNQCKSIVINIEEPMFFMEYLQEHYWDLIEYGLIK